MRKTVGFIAICFTVSAFAAEPFDDKFRQLDEVLPSANTYRTASGAPGAAYWQQRADYTIRAKHSCRSGAHAIFTGGDGGVGSSTGTGSMCGGGSGGGAKGSPSGGGGISGSGVLCARSRV